MGNGAGKGGRGTGPTKEDLSIVSSMVSMMTQMLSISDKVTDSFKTQADATAEMAKNMKGMGTDEVVNQLTQVNITLREVLAALQNLNTTSAATFAAISSGALGAAGSTAQLTKASQDAAAAAESQKTSFEELKDDLLKTGKDSLSAREKLKALGKYLGKEFPVATGAALGALAGLRQSFRGVMAIGKGFFGFATSIASSIFSIGTSILSIPFKLFDGLINMAKKGGGVSELAEAINEVRKEFGALAGPVASTILSTANNVKSFTVAGIKGTQLFGNVADTMKRLTALFVAGGAAFQSFTNEIKKNGIAIMAFQKGLGASDEQMGALASTAKATGTSITDNLIDITKQATHLGKQFNIDFKLISKDMFKANADMAHFGSMSQKQIGVAVTYFRKLGVELDKVTGTMDAFSTFDEAADKVSTLNQVFGTNVDAMKLVNSENPAETIEHLRKEFAKAGIDGEKMNRAQRKMIKDLTNLDDAETKLIFSSKNRGVSLEQIRKQGDKAEKKTMTQTEAMSKLADAMDRVFKSGQTKEGGFLEHFKQGFMDGIYYSKEFQAVMKNIRASLMEVWAAGKRLGQAFVQYFPGFNEFLEGLAGLFQPGRFSRLANGVTDILVGFMKDLGAPGGKASFSDLMTKLKDHFFNFFKSEGPEGQKTLNGFTKMMDAIKVIIAGAVSWILNSVTSFIKDLVNFIKNPAGVPGVGNMGQAATEYLSPITMAFRDGMKELWPALSELFTLLFDKLADWIGPKVEAFVKKHWIPIMLFMVGPMVTRALLGAGVSMLGQGIAKMITTAITGPAVNAAVTTSTSVITNSLGQSVTVATTTASQTAAVGGAGIFSKMGMAMNKSAASIGKFMTSNVGKALGKVAIVAAIATAAVDVGAAIREYGDKLEKAGFDPATAKIAAGTTGLIDTLTFGLLPDGLKEKIAFGIAEIGTTLEKTLDDWFGPGLADNLKMRMASTFQIFGGLGDLISGLWNGDSKKVEQALKDIGTGILDNIVATFIWFQIELPKLIMQLGVYIWQGIYKLLGWLSNKIGDIFQALENIPIFGPLFGLLGDFFHKLGSYFNKIAELFGKLQEFLKSINITQWFKDAWAWMTKFFSDGESSSGGFFTRLFGYWKKLIAVIEEPYRLLRKIFNIIFSWDTGKSFLENLKDKWDAIVGAFTESANKIFDLFNGIFTDVSDAWNWVTGKIGEGISWIGEKLSFIVDPIVNAFNWVKTKAEEAFQFIKTAWDVVMSKLGPAINAITLPFRITYNVIKTIFEMIYEEVIQPVFGGIVSVATTVVDGLKSAWESFKNFIVPIFDAIKSAWDATVGFVVQIAQTVLDKLSQRWNEFKAGVAIVFGEIKSAWDMSVGFIVEKAVFVINKLSEGWNSFKNLVMPVIDAINEKVSTVYNFFADIFEKIWGTLSGWVGRLVAWGERILAYLTEPGVKAKDRLMNAFTEIWNGITSILSWENFKQLGSDILDGLLGGLGNIGTKIKEKFSGAVKSVKSFLGISSPSKVFAEMGGDMLDGVLKAFDIVERLKEKVDKIVPMIDSIFKKVTDSVKTNFEMVFSVIQHITNRILTFLETNVPRALKVFEDLKEGIIKIFTGETFFNIFTSLVDGIKEKLGKLADLPIFKDIITLAKKVFKIQSPSKVFMKIGDQIVEGMFTPMSEIPQKTSEVMTDAVSAAKDQVSEMPQVTPQATPQAAAPQVPNLPAGDISNMLLQMSNLADVADKAKGVDKKIQEFNSNAASIAGALNGVPAAMAPIVSALTRLGALLKGQNVGIVESTKQFVELLDYIQKLGDIGVKARNEDLSNKIYALNMVAGQPGNGLNWHLSWVPEYYAPVVAAAKAISVLIPSETSGKMLESVKNFIELLESIDKLGDIGVKARKEDLANKIYALNIAAGDRYHGLGFHLSKVPESYGPITDALKSITAFLKTSLSTPEVLGALNNLTTLASSVTSTIDSALTPTLKAMNDMVNAVSQIDAALSKAHNINLKTTLDKFKTNFGSALGSSGKHVVSAKDVTINVNFTVLIDSTKLEGAILAGDSKIKQRINTLIGAVREMPEEDIGVKGKTDVPNYTNIRKNQSGGAGL